MDIMYGIMIIVKFISYMKIGLDRIWPVGPSINTFSPKAADLELGECTVSVVVKWIGFVILNAIDLSILISAIFL